jgi:NAD(P)-dependent dehydrogenase (short-subunit alcohol dehydrogenase family)
MSQVVFVTGALSGIGRATAMAFARMGATVVAAGRRQVEGDALKQELLSAGAQAADFFKVDVTQEEDIVRALASIEDRYGQLDVAVNNAGIEGEFSGIDVVTTDVYRSVFDTNVLGLMLSMKHEVLLMKKTGAGSIINISSIGGKVGFPNSAIYSASKHAVEGLTKSAALEVAALGIRINSVAPGPTATPMVDRLADVGLTKETLSSIIPAKRLGLVEDVAQAIVFLGSTNSEFIMGHCLAVDGGYLAQ